MKILAFGASLRKGSFSKMALQAAVAEIKKAGVEVEKLDLNDYPMPAYNWDLEQEGMPEVVEKFKAKIAEASGLLISSPEYNHSVPGYLKNIIDWASRNSPELKNVFQDKTVSLITVSDGSFGGIRAAIAWLPTFKTLGLVMYSAQMPIPKAQAVFDSQGKIIDPKMKERLEKFALGFVEFTQKHPP